MILSYSQLIRTFISLSIYIYIYIIMCGGQDAGNLPEFLIKEYNEADKDPKGHRARQTELINQARQCGVVLGVRLISKCIALARLNTVCNPILFKVVHIRPSRSSTMVRGWSISTGHSLKPSKKSLKESSAGMRGKAQRASLSH